MAVWDEFLTENDKKTFDASGYGAYLGPGEKPAVLVVDVSYAFSGEKGDTLDEAQSKWHNACGPQAWDSIASIQELLVGARAKNLPIFYSTGFDVRPDGFAKGLWRNSRIRETTPPVGLGANEIVHELAPEERDIVLYKRAPSVFYGTPLMAHLTELGVDSLIIVGTTTSGCVRATVVDAFSNNIRAIVAEEGCFDRGEASHALALFDMNMKYADVVPTSQVLDYFEMLAPDLYAGKIASSTPDLVSA